MTQEYVINVSNVTKQFKAYADKGTMLKERVIFEIGRASCRERV